MRDKEWGTHLSWGGSLQGHGDDGLAPQQQEAHGALLLLLLFVLLAADATELLTVSQDHVHVFVKGWGRGKWVS